MRRATYRLADHELSRGRLEIDAESRSMASGLSAPAPLDGVALPTGMVTFLFTDIEASTQRWDAHREAMSAAVQRHDAIGRAAMEAHGGYVFKTLGDAFCVAFARPEAAVAATLDFQRALAAEDFVAVGGLRVRAALHTGVADERNSDYLGPTLNRLGAAIVRIAAEQSAPADDLVRRPRSRGCGSRGAARDTSPRDPRRFGRDR